MTPLHLAASLFFAAALAVSVASIIRDLREIARLTEADDIDWESAS